MNLIPPHPTSGRIDYPESDGLPMADNTKQFEWIVTLYDNIAALLGDREDVFVCGNQFWYPVEGHPEIVVAPDVYVVFGRPKGHRPSWKQWEEDHVPLTVVFEVLSPRNTVPEMADKHAFYEDHGVEEYYVYDPESNTLQVYLRRGDSLRRVRKVEGFASPRLGIRFDLSGPEMIVLRPDGRPFLSFEQLEHRANRAEERADRLGELALKVQAGQASPEEVQELLRLARPSP